MVAALSVNQESGRVIPGKLLSCPGIAVIAMAGNSENIEDLYNEDVVEALKEVKGIFEHIFSRDLF